MEKNSSVMHDDVQDPFTGETYSSEDVEGAVAGRVLAVIQH